MQIKGWRLTLLTSAFLLVATSLTTRFDLWTNPSDDVKLIRAIVGGASAVMTMCSVWIVQEQDQRDWEAWLNRQSDRNPRNSEDGTSKKE